MRRSLFSDERGTTLMEFALLLMPMIVLIAGTVEAGRLLFTKVSLEGAVMEAARATTAMMESSEESRDELLRTLITERMSSFSRYEDKPITIETQVYRNFASSFPENYTDLNGNGRYDPPQGQQPGEPFIDRNNNGLWDPSTPTGGTLGGPGDVVSYTATFSAPLFFGFLNGVAGMPEEVVLNATTVVRNEPVARRTRS